MKPRKGQFIIYDKSVSHLVKSIILPVPTERTKGVLITQTVFGNLIVGPTAEDQSEREVPTTDEVCWTLKVIALKCLQKTKLLLLEKAENMVPSLQSHRQNVVAAYAGIRPATEFKEYQISVDKEKQWITVGGIRSTGLTAAVQKSSHRSFY